MKTVMRINISRLIPIVIAANISLGIEAHSLSPDSVLQSNDSTQTRMLNEIVVSADLHRRRGNEDIIVITKQMCEGTSNTGELLGKLAGVFYNPMSTQLQVMGSSNILLLVDGVTKNADFLKRLNPDRFGKVSITYMPTGMYAGYDAVINLQTKPLYVGYQGVVLSETVVSPNGNNGPGKDLRKSRTAGQFTYTREKINFDFVTDYTFEQQGNSDYFKQSYPLNGITETTLEFAGKRPNKNTRLSSYTSDLSIDYEIARNHSLSGRVSFSPSSHREIYDYILRRDFTTINRSDTVSQTHLYDVGGRRDLFGGLWYRGALKKWGLNAHLTYTDISYRLSNDIYRSLNYSYSDNRDVASQYFSGAVEAKRYSNDSRWLLSLSDNFIVSNYNERRAETLNPLSDSHDFRNTVTADVQFVGSRTLSIGGNVGFSVFRNSYSGDTDIHVTPKGGLQAMWNPSNKLAMRLNYTVGTQYPPLSSLQNYGQFTDSLIYTTGNPALRPGVNHEVVLSSTFLNSLTLEGRYTHNANSIFRYYEPKEGVVPSGANTYFTENSPVNGTYNIWSVNLTYTKQFGKRWMASATGKIVGNKASYGMFSNSKVLPEYSWFILYQIPERSWQFYLSGSMQSYSMITSQIKQWSLDDGMAISVSKTMLQNRLQIVGMWYLPVHLSDGRWHGGLTSESYITSYWANNQFRKNNLCQLSIVYMFNKGNNVRKYNRASESIQL